MVQSKEIKMLTLKYANDTDDQVAYEIISSIPHICEVRSKTLIIEPNSQGDIKLCIKAPQSELIAEVKLLIRNYVTKEHEEVLQFDINVCGIAV